MNTNLVVGLRAARLDRILDALARLDPAAARPRRRRLRFLSA
ncbi:MAG TPA: hypothetical protein VKT18_09745 [Acidimicrobiales bacterium]|nr:hypothetical protein [Acidimicrobiales bacterium]